MTTTNTSASLVALDSAVLTERLTALASDERKHLVDFLRHLAEFDARKLFRGLGYSSLYVYCRDCLKLSDASAYRRYTVARLLTRFPVIAEFLEDGRLNLTRVAKLNDVLTDDNHRDLLERASIGSERDIDVLVATLCPKPDVTDSIRRIPAPPVSTGPKTGAPTSPPPTVDGDVRCTSAAEVREPALSANATVRPSVGSACEPSVTSTPSNSAASRVEHSPHRTEHCGTLFSTSAAEVRVARPPRMEVEATSGTSFSVRMRVGPEFLAEFEAVKAALSHKFPEGHFEDVLRECFRITLEACERRRAGKTRSPKASTSTESRTPTDVPAQPEISLGQTRPELSRSVADTSSASALAAKANDRLKQPRPARSRYVSAEVRRTVWARDGGRCAFVSADGRRCDSRHQLEVHHREPFASGGDNTADNLALRCRQHNAYEAELAFGTEFMKAKTSKLATRSTALPPRKWSSTSQDSAPTKKSSRESDDLH